MKLKIGVIVFLLTLSVYALNTFAAQYNFTPRVSARETYTDNVFLTDENTVDDFITDVSAGGTLSILGRTSGMNFVFDPAYVWYEDGSRENTWRLPATLDIWSNLSPKTRFEFFNRFLRSEDPDENRPTIAEDTGEIRAPGDSTVRRGRGWYITNFTTARIDNQFGRDDRVYGQFLYSLRREEDPDSNENDRYAPSAGVTYWFGPQWGTTVDVRYTRALFNNSDDYHDLAGTFQLMRRLTRTLQLFGRYAYAYRDNDGDDQQVTEGDYQVHAPSAGINYEFAKDARVSLGLGYYYQEFKDSEFDNQDGLFINGDLFKRWNFQRWSASLLGQAGLDRNDFGNERLGFEQYAGIIGNATYNFTRNVSGNLNLRYRYSEFVNESREDERIGLGAGLSWLANKWLALSLDYNYSKLNSTDVEDYDENRVLLRLTLQPDRPWRF